VTDVNVGDVDPSEPVSDVRGGVQIHGHRWLGSEQGGLPEVMILIQTWVLEDEQGNLG
jgi:hypothetical protein